jgi:hypothetical protein
MTTRQATVFVADEFTYSLNGKFNVFGIYGSDINIPLDPFITSQLIFVFVIETAPDDPYQSLSMHVTLPGGDARHLEIPLPRLIAGISDQKRWCLKYPLLFTNPILRPGPVEAKVIHEKGEISTAAPFIVLRPIPVPVPTEQKH